MKQTIKELNNFIVFLSQVEYKKEEIKKEEIKKEEIKKEEIKKEKTKIENIIVEENVIEENVIVCNLDKIEGIIKPLINNNFSEGLSFLDDKILPAFNLNFSEALLEIKKNPKCVPFQVYIDRWKYFNKKHIDKQNRQNKNKNNITSTIIIDELLLPPFNLSLPIAITKIQNNPLCVPSDLYIKKWNEIKTLSKFKKTH